MNNLRFSLAEFKRTFFTAILVSVQVYALFTVAVLFLSLFQYNWEQARSSEEVSRIAHKSELMHIVASVKDLKTLTPDQKAKVELLVEDFWASHPESYSIVFAQGNALQACNQRGAEHILVIGKGTMLSKHLAFEPSGKLVGRYIPVSNTTLGVGSKQPFAGGQLTSIVQDTGGEPISLLVATSSKMPLVEVPTVSVYLMDYAQLKSIRSDIAIDVLSGSVFATTSASMIEFCNNLAEATAHQINFYPKRFNIDLKDIETSANMASIMTGLVFVAILVLGLSTAALLSMSVMKSIRANSIHWLYGATKGDLQIRVCWLLSFYLLPGLLVCIYKISSLQLGDIGSASRIRYATLIILTLLYLISIFMPLRIIKKLEPMQVLRSND